MARPTLADLAARRYRKQGPNFPDMETLLLSLRECALGGALKRIARRTRKGTGRIYAQAAGEELSWLEEGCDWMDASSEVNPREKALAPLAYLVSRYSSGDDGVALTVACYAGTIAGMLRHSCQLGDELLSVVDPESDGGEEITAAELPTIEAAIDHHITQVHLIRRMLQARAGGSASVGAKAP